MDTINQKKNYIYQRINEDIIRSHSNKPNILNNQAEERTLLAC